MSSSITSVATWCPPRAAARGRRGIWPHRRRRCGGGHTCRERGKRGVDALHTRLRATTTADVVEVRGIGSEKWQSRMARDWRSGKTAHVSVTVICLTMPIMPFFCSTAVGVEAATAMIAPWPGGRIETNEETPNMPRLEMVKVPGHQEATRDVRGALRRSYSVRHASRMPPCC